MQSDCEELRRANTHIVQKRKMELVEGVLQLRLKGGKNVFTVLELGYTVFRT